MDPVDPDPDSVPEHCTKVNFHFFPVQDDESSERDSGTGDSKRSYDNMEHVVDTVIHSFLAARGEGWSISPPPPSVSDLGTAHLQ